MNGRIVLGILLVLVLIAGAIGLGVYAYNMGLAQGASDSARLPAPGTGVAPYGYPYFARPFFFWPLGCLFPFFFILLVFGLVRGLWWGGRGGWRWHHMNGEHPVPPMFEEWHRKAHEPKT